MKYSFLRRRWRRRRERLSEAEGDVARRKRGFCLTRSVNCWVALSGEWARDRRVCAMCVFGAGEDAIWTILALVGSQWKFLVGIGVHGLVARGWCVMWLEVELLE